MIALVVDGHEHAFTADRIWIGSGSENDVIVPTARKRHAMLTGNDLDGYQLHNFTGWRGTRVNGERVRKEIRKLADGDRLAIGKSELVYRVVPPAHYAAGDPAERDLLAAIDGGDDHARLVYADWLEQRGDATRAAFLRHQHAIMTTHRDGDEFHAHALELRLLAPSIELAWRQRLARPFVEGCSGFEVPCAKDWSQMRESERPDVRHCDGCRKNVYYCTTMPQALAHAMRGNCVAVDASQVRRRGDLQPPLAILSGMMPQPRR